MKKNKIIVAVVIAVMLLGAGSLSAKTQLTLRGAYNMFSANGKDADYIAGDKDFPVVPAYKALAAGIGLTFFTSKSFAVGFDVRYGLSAKVDLRDPSDGETINVDTPKNLFATLNFYQYFNLSKQMQIFVCLGGGGEYRMGEDKEYTSTLGSKIIIVAPEKPFSPLAAAGIGFQYMFTNSIGASLEFHGAYIFRTVKQVLLSPALGINFKF